jgi:hypothetical protein
VELDVLNPIETDFLSEEDARRILSDRKKKERLAKQRAARTESRKKYALNPHFIWLEGISSWKLERSQDELDTLNEELKREIDWTCPHAPWRVKDVLMSTELSIDGKTYSAIDISGFSAVAARLTRWQSGRSLTLRFKDGSFQTFRAGSLVRLTSPQLGTHSIQL